MEKTARRNIMTIYEYWRIFRRILKRDLALDRTHYWKRDLCRVSKIEHSAKTLFAECRTRQRIALDKNRLSAKDFFAECQALGKSAALDIGCPA